MTDKIIDGDVRSASRLMRLLDDEVHGARDDLDALFSHTGNAYILGVTGNPGSGKSTLVDQLISKSRAENLRVGCIAIDPTSPFSGGAILGDRIRMGRHATDPGVFIRSAATRGNLGGLSAATPAMMLIMDAMGFDLVIVETVGVGQAEVDIAAQAQTTIVVTVPGLGDEVQAAKAGVLEIADIFVVNKSDRPMADRLARELNSMLDLDPKSSVDTWRPPVIKTVATSGENIDSVWDAIASHRALPESDERKTRRTRHLLSMLATATFQTTLRSKLKKHPALIRAVYERERSPYDVLAELLRDPVG